RLEQRTRVFGCLQQTADAVADVDADLDGPPFQLRDVPHRLRIPDPLHVLPGRRDQHARVKDLVRLVQELLARDALAALDLEHHVLAVPDDPPELGGPQPRRLAPQLQLPPHRGDDGDAPLVVRVHLPSRLVRLPLEPYRFTVHRHTAPSVVPRRTAAPYPYQPPRQPGQHRTTSGQSPTPREIRHHSR